MTDGWGRGSKQQIIMELTSRLNLFSINFEILYTRENFAPDLLLIYSHLSILGEIKIGDFKMKCHVFTAK